MDLCFLERIVVLRKIKLYVLIECNCVSLIYIGMLWIKKVIGIVKVLNCILRGI